MAPSRLTKFFRGSHNYQMLSLVVVMVLIAGIPESFSVNQITLDTPKNSFVAGELIQVKGQVANLPNSLVAIEVKDPSGITIMVRTVKTVSDGNFVLTFKLSSAYQIGDYKIIANSQVEGSTIKSVKVITLVSMKQNVASVPTDIAIHIPVWVKNNANWWSTGKIADSDFKLGIGYMVQNEIIVIPHGSPNLDSSQNIPTWVKNDAGWWSTDQISDSEFVGALQYLITNGIIAVK